MLSVDKPRLLGRVYALANLAAPQSGVAVCTVRHHVVAVQAVGVTGVRDIGELGGSQRNERAVESLDAHAAAKCEKTDLHTVDCLGTERHLFGSQTCLVVVQHRHARKFSLDVSRHAERNARLRLGSTLAQGMDRERDDFVCSTDSC